MLTKRLQQLKDQLDDKAKSSDLNKSDLELLEELRNLDKISRGIRRSRGSGDRLSMIMPAPDRCPTCGRRF